MNYMSDKIYYLGHPYSSINGVTSTQLVNECTKIANKLLDMFLF